MKFGHLKQRGFTLIELIVALVIIALAAATLVGTMTAIAARSAETLQLAQSANIANSYLRDMLARPFAALAAGVVVNDAAARDQFGTPIAAGLGAFQVNVVTGRSPDLAPTVPFVDCAIVTVRVTAPNQVVTVLSAYRTNHP
jgi:prepilin-type N-terminal cleavage/methylation domain-containing protein